MSYQPSNILKAWTLLVRDSDPTAVTAAANIQQLAADELLHAWLEGWIAPVGKAKPVELESKPVELESKPAQLDTKPAQPKPKAPIKSIPLGKQIPGLVQAYKSAPVIINGIMARDLMNQMAIDKSTSVTNLLTQCGFKNGLGSLKSSVEKERICTHWGEWLIELLGDQIMVQD